MELTDKQYSAIEKYIEGAMNPDEKKPLRQIFFAIMN
jgi:hypothetical protein